MQLKNPVMKTMKRMLRLEEKAGFNLKLKMETGDLLSRLHNLMTEKVKVDLVCVTDSDVLRRRP